MSSRVASLRTIRISITSSSEITESQDSSRGERRPICSRNMSCDSNPVPIREDHLQQYVPRRSQDRIQSLDVLSIDGINWRAAKSKYLFVQPSFAQFNRHRRWADRCHIWRSFSSSSWAHSPGMRELNDARGATFLRYGRPSLPFTEVRLLQRILMAHDITLNGKVSNIYLNLTSTK